MAAEVPGSIDTRAAPVRWKPWAPMAAAAVALLLLSEALWLWQTWPVRELLQPAVLAGTGAR
jgi:hypothetical protein